MPERARTDLWEPWGSNPPGRPGPEPDLLDPRPDSDSGYYTSQRKPAGSLNQSDVQRMFFRLHVFPSHDIPAGDSGDQGRFCG
jgi:hypothetical protein